jgi:hypothetical protein
VQVPPVQEIQVDLLTLGLSFTKGIYEIMENRAEIGQMYEHHLLNINISTAIITGKITRFQPGSRTNKNFITEYIKPKNRPIGHTMQKIGHLNMNESPIVKKSIASGSFDRRLLRFAPFVFFAPENMCLTRLVVHSHAQKKRPSTNTAITPINVPTSISTGMLLDAAVTCKKPRGHTEQ